MNTVVWFILAAGCALVILMALVIFSLIMSSEEIEDCPDWDDDLRGSE